MCFTANCATLCAGSIFHVVTPVAVCVAVAIPASLIGRVTLTNCCRLYFSKLVVSSEQICYNAVMGLQRALCGRFHAAVELVGRRWTGAVIQLLLDGRMRYAELRSAIPEISDRMLSERLRELETEGIVARRVIPETPVRVEYELTEKGRALE